MCAHPVVGDEPVAVILPDVILDEYESDLSRGQPGRDDQAFR